MEPAEGYDPPPVGRWDDLADALERARPKVERIFVSARIPPEDAEDLLHDAFTQLLSHGDTISDPEAWLVATVKCCSLGYWRARRRRVVEQLDQALIESLVESLATPEERVSLACDLERQLRELPGRCRRLLQMRYRLGLEPCELAEELGYRADSVRKVTRRCLDSLAVRLVRGGYHDEVPLHG